MSELFDTIDLGVCSHFLGISFERSHDGLFLSQKAYAERIGQNAGLGSAKPTETPLPLAHPLHEDRKPTFEPKKQERESVTFRELFGALLHLSTRTRPGVATAVPMLGKLQSDPGSRH